MGMLPGKNFNFQKVRNGILSVMGYFPSLVMLLYSTLYSNYLVVTCHLDCSQSPIFP